MEVKYPLGPDSLPHDGIPKGTVTTHVWKDSQIFPGTIRRYYVYVPAEYDAAKPAALMVYQDGHTYIWAFAIQGFKISCRGSSASNC